ncbi:hypothetical protein DFJ73DRAFT_863170 [Zopfochytrium polystomum]|nr:hypothetical protein DFJ73DRAFT_863170 [Zopfochytrium polystomum]
MDAPTIAIPLCAYLPGRARFVLATLLRLPQIQALALHTIESANIFRALSRGRAELIRFRLKHATVRLGSVSPPETLLWTLQCHEVPTRTMGRWAAVLIECWIKLNSTDCAIRASEAGDIAVLQQLLELGQTFIEMDEVSLECVDAAAARGRVDVLEWWMNCGIHVGWGVSDGPELASTNGHLPVLEWWIAHSLPLNSSQHLIILAASCGFVEVLDFWRRNLPDFAEFIDCGDAIQNGHVQVLEWLTRLGYPMRGDSARMAARYDQAAVLEWLHRSGLQVDWDRELLEAYFNDVKSLGTGLAVRWLHDNLGLKINVQHSHFQDACAKGAVGVLDYLVDAGFEDRWKDDYLSLAAAAGHLSVFEWRLKRIRRRLAVAPKSALFHANANGQVEVLQWFQDQGISVLYRTYVIRAACVGKSVAILQWWKDAMGAVKLPSAKIIRWSLGDAKVLEWWKQSGLPIDWPSSVSMTDIARNASGFPLVDALQWWKENGTAFENVVEASAHFNALGEIQAFEWMKMSGFTVDVPQAHTNDNYCRWWTEHRRKILLD